MLHRSQRPWDCWLLFPVNSRILLFYQWKSWSREKGSSFPKVPRWAGARHGAGCLPHPSPVPQLLAPVRGAVQAEGVPAAVPPAALPLAECPRLVLP